MLFYRKRDKYKPNLLLYTEDITNKLNQLKKSLEDSYDSDISIDTEYVSNIITSKDIQIDSVRLSEETNSIFEPKSEKKKLFSKINNFTQIIPISSSNKNKNIDLNI